jgi:hypothetical protein
MGATNGRDLAAPNSLDIIKDRHHSYYYLIISLERINVYSIHYIPINKMELINYYLIISINYISGGPWEFVHTLILWVRSFLF